MSEWPIPGGGPPPEDVVRSVFDHGATSRLTHSQLAAVLDVVTGVLTRGCNPVQEESISSSSLSPSPAEATPTSSFWFMLSPEGALDHVSDGSTPLLGFRPCDLSRHSVFSLVSVRDHHIVPPILHAGPSTSMSCRMHLRRREEGGEEGEAPFDVTFAKLSTRQLGSEYRTERSATLCVARSVSTSHGTVTLLLDSTSTISDYENSSELSLSGSELLGRHVSQLCSKADQTVLDTLIESQSECSADLRLSLGSHLVTATVRAIHSPDQVRLLCNINRLLPCASPPSTMIQPHTPPPHEIQDYPQSMNNNNMLNSTDPLSQICSTLFSEDYSVPMDTNQNFGSPAHFEQTMSTPPVEVKETKPKKTRKPRVRKPKTATVEPVKDATLKKLLTTSIKPVTYHMEPCSMMMEPGVMYQASTMSAQPLYMNNNMSNVPYQTNQCSSYMPSPMGPADFQVGPQGGQMVPQQWSQEYYQQHQVPFAATAPKSLKRKPTPSAERPNKLPYGQAPTPTSNAPPDFAYQQSVSMMDPMSQPSSEEYHMQTMNSHLSPYRYSPGSSPYWPSNGRPPSRTEMIRMELRNSIQAKQLANQQRIPMPNGCGEVGPMGPSSQEMAAHNGPSMGADSLGFDLDIVLKDSDGSLMDSDLDSVYDFNLAGGCGFQFDMENDATRCLVMKLLS